MRAARTIGVAIALQLALVLPDAGCADFPSPSTVTDLRVLAVRAEPSEIILQTTDPMAPPAIPAITLTPLVVDPRGGGRPVTVTVTACANDPGAQGPPSDSGDPTGFPSGGARTTVGSALCDGAPTEIPIASGVVLNEAGTVAIGAQLSPEWVADAFTRDVFPGPGGKIHGGFDLGMPVVFQLRVRAGDEIVDTIKRVIFWSHALNDQQRPNQLPVIPGVAAFDRRDPDTAEPVDAVTALEIGTPRDVPGDGVWILPASATTGATALAEPYVTAVLDRVTGDVRPDVVARETLSYQFFATAGTFSPFQTSSEPPPGVTATRVHTESKYQPPPPKERPTDGADVTIWIVVRDDRGGVWWEERTLRVAPP